MARAEESMTLGSLWPVTCKEVFCACHCLLGEALFAHVEYCVFKHSSFGTISINYILKKLACKLMCFLKAFLHIFSLC